MKQSSIWDYLGILTILGAALALIYVVVAALQHQDSPWPLIGFIVLLTGILLADKVIDLYFRVRERIDARQAHRMEILDANYHVSTRPPQAVLPTTTVTAMRLTQNGVTRPIGAQPAQPQVNVETVANDGEVLTVPLIRLQRFLSLPTPSRAEWIGDRAMYSQCAQFCMVHGLLTQDKRGGYKWVSAYDRDSRRQWALQFDPAHTLPSPTTRNRRQMTYNPSTLTNDE